MQPNTQKCKCGDWYLTFSMYAGDQSACPRCRGKVEASINGRYPNAT